MIAPDVNVLIYALRDDSSHHEACRDWLERARTGPETLLLFEPVMASVLRIVSNHRIYVRPTAWELAASFFSELLASPTVCSGRAGDRHWPLFLKLCRDARCQGDLVPDAYLAALAIEHECEWITTDRDFARFPGLRWSLLRPAESR